MKILPLVILALDGSFIHGLLQALGDAGMPHTVEQLGGVLGIALYGIGSQLYQRWCNRRQLRNDLAAALADHLAGHSAPVTPTSDGL